MKHSIHYSILALSVLFFYACSKSNSSGGSTKPKTAVVTTFAGSGTAGNADGTGTASQFDHPYGVAIDASGKVYVGDENNALIREITSAGLVSPWPAVPMAMPMEPDQGQNFSALMA